MNKSQKLINVVEGISSSQRKVFVAYAKEILAKLKKDFFDADEKQLRMTLRKVMQNMALPKDNPNYKNSAKYMPDTFDKKLFDNGDKNTYQSVWMSMTDAAHDTVFRQAMK